MLDLLKPISSDLTLLEQILFKSLTSNNQDIASINEQIIRAGGKRMRPALFLLICNILDYQNPCRTDLAAALELVHTSSLLHDDVIDNSKTRRNKITVNENWSNKIAILAGDRTFAVACQLVLSAKNLEVIEKVTNCIKIMSESEIIQSQLLWNPDISENEYFDVIYGKTAILFESSAIICPILAKSEILLQNIFASIGKNLGLAFQIVDDCLDFEGTDNSLGKPSMSDIVEGKITLPIIYALQQFPAKSSNFRKLLSEICEKKQITKNELSEIKSIVISCGALENAKNTAKKHVFEATRHLESLTEKLDSNIHTNLSYQSLAKIADFIVDRKF